jgi:hypothetical protein
MMEEFLRMIFEPLREVGLIFWRFIPSFLAMLVIVIAGLIAAWIVKRAFLLFSRAIQLDTWSDRMGFTALLRKGDLWIKPSEAVGSLLFWLLFIATTMASLRALRLATLDKLVSQFFLYLPRVFSVILILVFGYILTGFIGRAVLIAAVNSGYRYAKLIAEAVKNLLLVLILAMTLEQLRVAPGIVIAAFSIIFGGIVLALAIAFGVGGIDSARRMIEKEQEKKEEKKDIEHI